MTREEFIRQVPLFKELRPEDITILCESTRTITLKKGEVLFRKDDEGTALYIIQQGSVKIDY